MATRKKAKQVKTYTQKELDDYAQKMYNVGVEQGRRALQRELLALLGVTDEIAAVEADIERHRYQDHEK